MSEEGDFVMVITAVGVIGAIGIMTMNSAKGIIVEGFWAVPIAIIICGLALFIVATKIEPTNKEKGEGILRND